MKIKYLLVIGLLFIVESILSQGKLYVSFYEPTFNIPSNQYTSYGQITNHSYSYTKSHAPGIYNITTPTIGLEFKYEESFEIDEDDFGCSGPCGYGEDHTDTDKFSLKFYGVKSSNYSGPSTVILPILYTSRNDFPANYIAAYVPKMVPITTTPSQFQPLFNSYLDARGNPPDVQRALHWFYLEPGTNKWKILPRYRNTFPLDKSVLEIFGPNFKDYLKDEKFLKLRYDVFQGEYDGEIFPFTIVEPSPQLLSFRPINTKCSYSNDGRFSMILDRDIGPNKKLVVSLFFKATSGPSNYSLLTQTKTGILIDNGNRTYTYNWPSTTPIASGFYKVRYQTLDSSKPDPVWNSLEGTEDGFFIGKPPAITFSAKRLSNVTCINGSDGGIELEITGGLGSYKYEINSNGTWVPFTNRNVGTQSSPVKQAINNLSKGNKTIRINDRNNCSPQ